MPDCPVGRCRHRHRHRQLCSVKSQDGARVSRFTPHSGHYTSRVSLCVRVILCKLNFYMIILR